MSRLRHNGFAATEIVIVLFVACLLLVVGQLIFRQSPGADLAGDTARRAADQSQPPLKLKSLGIELDAYNPLTGRAGDLEFTKRSLENERLFSAYGYVPPADMSDGTAPGPNPRAVFTAPVGTKVRALVDGEVVRVMQLAGDTYSIHIASDASSNWFYELRYVAKPRVRAGDEVVAGRVIAEIGTERATRNSGYGQLAIGIMRLPRGNLAAATYVCPFKYLEPTTGRDTLAHLKDLYRDWEAYRGNSQIYDETKQATPGCLTTDEIQEVKV